MNVCTGSADIWAMIVSAQNCFFSSTITHQQKLDASFPGVRVLESKKMGAR